MPIRGKTNKQTNNNKKKKKTSAQISPYTQLTGPTLEGQTTKGKKEFILEAWEKETVNTISLQKWGGGWSEKYFTNEAPTRNTGIQINKEEIGKLSEKISE